MIGSLTFAQADFSGYWKLNTSKSTISGDFTMSPKEIVINQSGNVMNVEKHSEFQGQEMVTNDKFTLDGKECINQGMMDSEKKSTASWSDDKKVLTINTKFSMGDGGDEMTFKEIYSFKGENLEVKLEASSSFGDMTETGVYEKQ